MIVQEHYKEYFGIYPVENKERIDKIKMEFSRYETTYLDKKKAEDALLKVHSKEHYENFIHLCKKKVNLGDLNFQKGLIDVALNAINASLKAADVGDFAAIRPAGHHAYKEKFAGFCYFNNVVIAIQKFLERDERVAIIDFDAHYGNGTHDLIKNDKNVFYLSIHADTKKYYPGVEYNSYNSYLINVEPKNEDDEKFLIHMKKIVDEAKKFNPDVLAISAGFDNWWEDKVLGFNIKKEETYLKIGKMLSTIEAHTFSLLEGGYHENLGKLVRMFVEGIT